MDAANVDLKGFTEDFYRHITYSHLQPVLDTLAWLKKETDVWFEITNLVIPQANDAMDDIRRMCQWILEHCGDQVPLHFTAFHPDFRMLDRPHTPHETLLRAHEVARREGLKFVYTGNVNDADHQSTYCPHCGTLVIERDWYTLGAYHVRGDRCGSCGGHVPGHFDERPGTWGRKRVPVEIARVAPGPQVVPLNLPSHAMKPTTEPAEAATPAPARDALLSRLTPEQHAPILSTAAEFVAAAIQGRSASLPDPALAGGATIPVMGAYVTLKRRGHLRACCGFLGESRELIEALLPCLPAHGDGGPSPPAPLGDGAAASRPERERPVQPGAGPARGRDRVDAVQVGRHGLRIHRGDASGLLLPGVAVEHGWDSESFLRHVCHKAGLPTTAWVDDETVLFTFESVEFGGPYDATVLGPDGARTDGLFAPRSFGNWRPTRRTPCWRWRGA